jgi:hypothetical protein
MPHPAQLTTPRSVGGTGRTHAGNALKKPLSFALTPTLAHLLPIEHQPTWSPLIINYVSKTVAVTVACVAQWPANMPVLLRDAWARGWVPVCLSACAGPFCIPVCGACMWPCALLRRASIVRAGLNPRVSSLTHG